MFPGAVLLVFALWGLWTGWRSDQRALAVTAGALVVAGLWLSFGPDGPFGLYRYVAIHAFGFEAIRAPVRFAVVAMLGLALLAAIGRAKHALHRVAAGDVTRQRAFAAVVVGTLLLEYANAPLAFVEAPVTDTAVGRWLRDAPGPGAVAYLPVGMDRENTPAMVEALQHGRPIVNGYSGQRPRRTPASWSRWRRCRAPRGARCCVASACVSWCRPWRSDTGDPSSPFVERATSMIASSTRCGGHPRARQRWWRRPRPWRFHRHPARCRFRRTKRRRSRCDGLGMSRPARLRCEPSLRRLTIVSAGPASPGASKPRPARPTGCRASSRPATSSRRWPPPTCHRCCTCGRSMKARAS